jgi:hypothetical protein
MFTSCFVDADAAALYQILAKGEVASARGP